MRPKTGSFAYCVKGNKSTIIGMNLSNYGRCGFSSSGFSMKDLLSFEKDIHEFNVKKHQVLENESLRQYYEGVVLNLLDCPTTIKQNKSTYFISAFIMECIQILNLQKDREYLLNKAWDVLDAGKYDTEMDISQKNALKVQIAITMHDLYKMEEAFNIYFDFIRSQLVQYKKTKRPIQIQLDDLVVGFNCAAHVGRFAEMALLGDLISEVFNAPEVFDFLNDEANKEQQLDYSAIYKLLKAYPIPNEPVTAMDTIAKYRPIHSKTSIKSMVYTINSEKEENLPTDPSDVEQQDLLDLHIWGKAVLWFQQIVMSGVVGDNKVFLYGYADIEGMDDSHGVSGKQHSVLEELGNAITDEEMKARVLSLVSQGKESESNTVKSCTVEIQFQFENAQPNTNPFTLSDDGTLKWKGTNKRTVSETHSTGDEIRITTTYDIEMTLVPLSQQ